MWLRSPSPDATRAAARLLGGAIAAAGGEGACLALCGPLGAGKTLFVKGLAEGLGVPPALVSSPTFVIANTYPLDAGRLLVHVDLYRVTDCVELELAGFLDWLEPGNVLAVEWADRLPEALPRDRLEIALDREGETPGSGGASGGSQRGLNAIASGPGAHGLLSRWRSAIANASEPAARALEIASD